MSCSSDEQELDNGGKAIVYGTVFTRANDITYVNPSGDNELINDWWVVFVTQNNTIEKIVSRESYKTTAVEQEGFQVELDGGTYTVYTFANISKSTVEGLLTGEIKTITEGKQMPDLTGVKFNINNVIPNGTLVRDLDEGIPMSSKIEKEFKAGPQSMSFEVIRMVAKMDFIFKNMCKSPVTLHSLRLLPINVGYIPLIPNSTVDIQYEESDPTILEGVDTTSLKFNFLDADFLDAEDKDSIVLEANSSTDNSKWYTHSFYVRESSASKHPTKHFRIELTIYGRDNKAQEAIYTITDKLSGQDFTGFNRNDYIQIPIAFTDFKVELEADSYAPIGGYPTEITENKKNEFYCKFATPGEFTITPYLRSASTGDLLYYPNCDYEIVSVDDPDKIFYDSSLATDVQGKLPVKDTTTGEIIGKLNTHVGTASVYIHIMYYPDPSVKTVHQDFYRRIYIIRENKS